MALPNRMPLILGLLWLALNLALIIPCLWRINIFFASFTYPKRCFRVPQFENHCFRFILGVMIKAKIPQTLSGFEQPVHTQRPSRLELTAHFGAAGFFLSRGVGRKVLVWDHLLLWVSACLSLPPKQFLNACPNLHETWYVCHATWAHLNGALHKSPTSVIPILWLLKLLRLNLNIALTPTPIFVKLGMYVMPHEAIPSRTSYILLISNTNAASS
jgi:hypothetical protein